ncbi:hypothetical protein GCM10023321_78650 [Pseudonocardia eucalypti]|uniref:DUF202 domain-containing protein n=1 Tax=Pseudonocardia eucalypti TaxID=648755 RepID=A0ABP9RBQ7_9PSEU|nr:putative membrane protein [Pseudonocardia eucalypti]
MSRRFPRGVFQVGEEPDPRFSLANERTFLAWIRTGLAFLAAGVAVRALPVAIAPLPRLLAAVAFVLVGLVVPITAWCGWVRTERALRTGAPLPGPGPAVVVALGSTLAAVVVLAGLLLT